MICRRVITKAALIVVGALVLGSIFGCEEETMVPVVVVQNVSQTKAKKTGIDRKALEVTEGNWLPAKNWERAILTRNPFRGFADAILAERISELSRTNEDGQSVEAVMLPAQMYNVKDYKLLAVITGTADSKAFVVDPSANRFVLRRGDLIGNNNGTVSSIQRDKIEVFEMISGEGKYIDILLYPEEKKSINLTFK